MRKFLFVSFTSKQSFTGGKQCTRRNLESVKALFGEANVESYVITPYQNTNRLLSVLKRVRDIFYGYMGGMQKKKEKEILQLIEKNGCSDVYIDSSLLGVAVKKIKEKFPKIRVYTFFHNVEYDFVGYSVKVNKDYLRFYWLILSKLNERYACKYSDKIIALNERDALRLKEVYNRVPDTCIPITFKPTYMATEETKQNKNGNREALFIGSYFYGNVEGIKWFCKYVLPKVDIHLIIVGAGMDRLQNKIRSKNVTIYSDVPDLVPFYENADFMVLPILSGGGMKVKTAEALMYGKFILATKEALIGYETTSEIAIQCDTADAFISAISQLKLSRKYNEPSRELFDRKYSFNASLPLFEAALRV